MTIEEVKQETVKNEKNSKNVAKKESVKKVETKTEQKKEDLKKEEAKKVEKKTEEKTESKKKTEQTGLNIRRWCDTIKYATVLQGGSLPYWKQKGVGADEIVYISRFNLVCDFFNHTACLHR